MTTKPIPPNKLIIFSIISIMLFLCCIEFSSRLILAFKKDSLAYVLYGFRTIEQAELLQKFKGKDGEAEYYKSTPSTNKKNPVNSLGFRGPEILEKKPRTIRIICLGSSTTYGTGLDYGDTYPAILQKKLNEIFRDGRYEVINGGQPGLNVAQITSLIKYEILALKPDIVFVMNINNNLKAPGFWFVDIRGKDVKEQQDQRHARPLIRLKNYFVCHSALACLIQEAAYSGISKYAVTFDWNSFSRALMSPDNIWEKDFEANLNNILRILITHNPEIKVVLLGEAVNTGKFSEMEGPFNKAKEIMDKKSKQYPENVYTLDMQNGIITAAKEGKDVWQTISNDPLHLVRSGNEIIANAVIRFLETLQKNHPTESRIQSSYVIGAKLYQRDRCLLEKRRTLVSARNVF